MRRRNAASPFLRRRPILRIAAARGTFCIAVQSMGEQGQGDTVFVRRLPFDWSETQVTQIFSDAGPVKRVDLIRDPKTRQSRGFAFVRFATGADAQEAVSSLDGSMQGGRTLRVEVAEKKRTGR